MLKNKIKCVFNHLICFEKNDKYLFKARNSCCVGETISSKKGLNVKYTTRELKKCIKCLYVHIILNRSKKCLKLIEDAQIL